MRPIADLPHGRSGLPDAAAVEESRRTFGRNALTPVAREPAWRKFLDKFDEPIIRILLAASLLKIIVDLFHQGTVAGTFALISVSSTFAIGLAVPRFRQWVPSAAFVMALVLALASVALGHPSYDGLAVMIAVVLATGVAFAAEYKSDREFEVLNAQMDAALVKVFRGGAITTVPLDEVVVGDLVTLEMGDEVPADGRIVQATELAIDQSLMTGESEPVTKSARDEAEPAHGPDSPACVYRGTQVVDGIGRIIVTEVGDMTMLGQLARRLGADTADVDDQSRVRNKLTISKDLTPLQQKLARLASLISRIGYAAAVAILVALIVKGVLTGDIHWPTSAADFAKVARRLLDNFVIMVIIIVVAVPEGLPMSVTVSLALAMQKMTRANSLVRQLVACETIGSATVICSDKTGTLTQNRMKVEEVALVGGAAPDSGPGSFDSPRSPLEWLVLNAAVNSTAHLESRDGKLITIGNNTEGALLQWLRARGVSYEQLRLQFPSVFQLHFSSDRKRMTTVVETGGRAVALVKGATEVLLSQSRQYLDAEGALKAWTPEARAEVEAAVQVLARRAMRTLAFGFAPLADGTPTDEASLHHRRDHLDEGMVFVGMVGIRDPIREDVPVAVSDCRQAGIEVKMITGDNPETARAIAADVGLLAGPDDLVLTSGEFNDRSDDDLKAVMPRLHVLARARPLDKYRLVRLLQEQGEVVAMTGDGTNDAPSLKRADVGLAMGISGTEVAKEASKIVLLDDAFSTIVKAVHWGRALYENIQRFVQFQLTINVSALVIAFLAPFLGFGEPPFTVLQFLWINIIMDTLAAIALCSEPPRRGLMREPPKRRDDSILTPAMLGTILTTAAFFVVVMCVLLVGMQRRADGTPGWFAGTGEWSHEFPLFTVRQATIFFTTYVLFQVWNLINCRSLTPTVSGVSRLVANPTFLAIAGLIVIGQLLIVSLGGRVFNVEPLTALDWLAIGVATSTVVVFAEAVRRFRQAVRMA